MTRNIRDSIEMPNDLIERFQSQGAAIDSVWTMFLLVHGALVASVYFGEKELTWARRIVILFAYGLFVLINSRALLDSYLILNGITSDLRDLQTAGRSPFFHTFDVISAISGHYADSVKTVIFVHLFAGIIVIYFIFLGPIDSAVKATWKKLNKATISTKGALRKAPSVDP